MHDEPWWKTAVVYQVYPRSFADSDGDGVGDLGGIRSRLDYLSWLGVDAIWISPVYPSPMADAGYDIADYCDIDPTFGTLEQFDALVADAHAADIKVLLDWVPNHTSDQHPWFVESRSSRDSPKRDWYIWRDEPNNWRAALGAGSAWTFDEKTEQYYLHFFLPQQPDLNWENAEVTDAMHDVLRFWLDRGVDGFRIDVAHCVGKDRAFADDERCLAGQPIADFNDQPASHEVLRGVRKVVDSYPGDRVIVGEVNIRSTEAVTRYYGSADELHLSFNFPPLDAPWDPVIFKMLVEEVELHLSAVGAWPTWVLSNHDNERHRTRFEGSLRRSRAIAVMLLTLRGTPFLFQGEELGLEDATITPETQVDPGGRDGCRAPIPWEETPPHGWRGADTWLPFSPSSDERSVEAQRKDSSSILHLYRRLLRARRNSKALTLGDFGLMDAPEGVLAYHRRYGDDERTVILNFSEHEREVELGGGWVVEVGSTDELPEQFNGVVAAESAVLLRRR